jgi:hypothetical protein
VKILLPRKIEIIFLNGVKTMLRNLRNGVQNQIVLNAIPATVQPQLNAIQIPQQKVMIL